MPLKMPLAAPPAFLRRSYTKDLTGVDLAITGVPFDQAVTHRTGTRFGPRAIREASALQPYDPPYGWPTNPLEDMAIIDYGDLAFDYAKVSDFPETLTAHIRTILAAGAGTRHAWRRSLHHLADPEAYAEKFGPLSVIHFDAHSDLWQDDDLQPHRPRHHDVQGGETGSGRPGAFCADRHPHPLRRLSWHPCHRRPRGA